MNKIICVISAPIETVSGYGCHSRDIVKALIKLKPDWDIKIIPQRWGDCPLTALKPGIDDDIIQRITRNLTLHKKPEIWMQITVPNEMVRNGEYNILVTAGIETTMAGIEWIKGTENADLIITPSEFAKHVLHNTRWEQVNSVTKQVEKVFQCNKPIEVLFEGLQEDIFFNKPQASKGELDDFINHVVKTEKNFLFVGHWLNGEFGHDRKDVGGLVDTFINTFKNKEDAPGLILKTSQAKFSIIDRTEMLKRIESIKSRHTGKLPKIYLLHGDLTDTEMNDLYNHQKVIAFVSFTKGEGFGRPLLEFGVTKKPIITTNWSGHIDFLTPENVTLLPGELKNIHPSAVWDGVIIKESSWFYVNYETASQKLLDVYQNYKPYKVKAEKHYNYIINNFTISKMEGKFATVLDKHVPKFAVQSELKLPILKKIEGINLPKLNKIS